jgi:hypothetical protein
MKLRIRSSSNEGRIQLVKTFWSSETTRPVTRVRWGQKP